MLIRFLILAIAAACWIAFLWFGLRVDWRTWTPPALLAVHVLPPVAIYLTGWAAKNLVRRRKLRKAKQRRQAAREKRQAAREVARQQHEQEMRHRQFGCDCRAVAIRDLVVQEDPAWSDESVLQQQTVTAQARKEDFGDMGMLDVLEPAITDALRHLYQQCGAAAAFPIYLQPPAELAAGEIIQRVRTLHARLIEELALPLKRHDGVPAILYLPSGDSAADSMIGLFDNTPDLPGAVVLAFDSPLWRAREEDTSDYVELERQQRRGKPGHGVFALLVTHPDLPAMLENAACYPDEVNSMTPFWEKQPPLQGHQALLTLAPVALREAMAQLAPLARIHRAAHANTDGQERRGRQLEDTMKMLLERVRIHAGLVEMPFAPNKNSVAPAERKDKKADSADCGWLVHNAGTSEYAKKRLSAIGSALLSLGSELEPIEMATNLAGTTGYLGRAASVGMLTLALARVQALQTPVLGVEFLEQHGIVLTMLMPLDKAAAQAPAQAATQAA